mgnify:CR=1 FL=1
MSKIFGFLKLIRIKNLLIIALLQILIKYTLINIYLESYQLDNVLFFIYLFTLLFTVAGGYIINDIFDVSTDQINKKNIINNTISIKNAKTSYVIMNFLTIIGTAYLVIETNKIISVFIFLFFIISLYKYSQVFKKQFLIGNIQVAFLTAFSIVNLVLLDVLNENNQNDYSNQTIVKIILIYTLFSFITTLVREIIKDIEDIEGDKKIKATTIPIVLGASNSKRIVSILLAITITGLMLIQYFQYSFILSDFEIEISIWGLNTVSFIYVTILQLLLILLLFNLNKSQYKNDFYFLSQFLKLIMLVAILSIPIFTYLHLKC